MITTPLTAPEERILILAPHLANAAAIRNILQRHGLTGEVCENFPVLLREVEQGFGAAVLTIEVLQPASLAELQAVLSRLPVWSVPPLVVLADERTTVEEAAPWPLQLLQELQGVLFLERPVRPLVLASTLRASLENRRRQYQVRDLLASADQAVRHRDEFLAMLGHELRNPLSPMRHTIDALRLRGDLSPDFRASLTLIDRQVRQLGHLVDDLLDVARVSQGRITLHKTILDLADVVQQAAATVNPLMASRSHQLTLSLPPSPVRVKADETRLTQVLTNLLNNAGRYTEEGGRIELMVGAEANEAVIRVRDNGIGIAAEEQTRIFDLFTQLGNGRAHTSGGLGLGLTLADRLVRLHGGRIEVHSEGPKRGSEFTVRLPAVSTPLAAGQSPAVVPGHSGHTILIVDNNAEAADSMAMLLKVLGHDVQVCYGAREALERTRSWQPEIVFLDLGMPEIDGYELARRLRQRWGQDTPRLIAITGCDMPMPLEEAGFERHLLKPVALEELQSLLAGRAEGLER